MKNLKNKINSKNGITLIALVITIIILIILSAITINLTIGENGILNKSKTAKENYNKQTATETINLKITSVQISKYAKEQRMPTLKELAVELEKDNEIEYVNGAQRIASTQDIDFTTTTSIFTKLKSYPYEFEINNSLQLASIDGIKIATIPSDDNEPALYTQKQYEENYSNGYNDGINFAKPTLLWTNPSPTSPLEPQTISLNLSDYNYILIITESNTTTNLVPKVTSLLKVSDIIPEAGEHELNNHIIISANSSAYRRGCYATTTGVTFTNCYYTSTIANDRIIPLYIYGIKIDLGIDQNIGY